MNAKKKDDGKSLGFWRENAEALTFAVIMALVIKQFAFEAYKVPTQSMEPTIIGRDTGGARLIANKFSYMLNDPARFDVVIFQYPHNRLLSYVKRCVGVGPEWLFIRGGDLYRADFDLDREAALAAAEPLRKPLAIQERLFDESECIPRERRDVGHFRDYWVATEGSGEDFRPVADEELVRVDARSKPVRLRFTRPANELRTLGGAEFAICNKRFDDWSIQAPERGGLGRMLGLSFPSERENPEPAVTVGDMRLRLEVRPEAAAGLLTLEIHDWSHDRVIALEIPVAGGEGRGRLRIGAEEHEVAATLPVGEWTEVGLWNYDDAVVIEFDGDVILEKGYRHDAQPAQQPVLNDSVVFPPPEETIPGEGELRKGDNTAVWGFSGGKADFRELDLARDVYYTESGVTDFHIPSDHYLMLGDNPPDSLDGRAWKVSEMRYRDESGETRSLLGDSEAVSDAPTRPGENPYAAESRFLDVFGNTHEIDPARIERIDYEMTADRVEKVPALIRYGNLVHRRYVQGRAYFVFFPILQIGTIR